MKKNLVTFLLMVACIQLHAQELLNKKGEHILPEPGNWSVGMDVIPLLKYAGNLFYNGSDSTRDFSITYPLAFTGKYVKKNNLSYRAGLRLGFGGTNNDSLVAKSGSTNVNEKVSNQIKENSANIYISGGIEKRKGVAHRVTGVYGVESMLLVKTHKTEYTYGNELDLNDQQASQVKKKKDGTVFGFGIRGFLGVEYFLAAKIGLAAEYGWGPSFANRGRGTIEKEVVDGNTTKIVIEETEKAFSFGFDNDIRSGSISLHFYF